MSRLASGLVIVGLALFMPTSADARPLADLAQTITHDGAGPAAYDAAKQELLAALRADRDGDAAIPVVISLLESSSSGANDVRGDVLYAIARPRVVACLARLATARTAAGLTGGAVLVDRLRDTTDARAIPALVAYLRRRHQASADFDVGMDPAFAILHTRFHDPPDAIALLWTAIPSPNSSLWAPAADVLRAYRGPHWIEWVKQGLTGADERRRYLALWIAYDSKEPKLRTAFAAAVADAVMHKRAYPNGVFQGLAVLQDLAASEPVARATLLTLRFGTDANGRAYDDSYAAQQALIALADHGAFQLEAADWKQVVAEMQGAHFSDEPFELAGHFDVTPIVPTLLAMLDDPSRGVLAARLIAQQRADAVVVRALHELPPHPVPTKLRLLHALQARALQTWAQDALPLLADADPSVVAATVQLLATSADPIVTARLAALSDHVLDASADPYRAIANGLKIRWDVARHQIHQGEPLDATITLDNTGAMPIVLPLDVSAHAARWQLVTGTTALGPLVPVLATSVRRLAKGQQTTLTVHLGAVAAALGPGRFDCTLQYFSRSRQRHWPGQPDFALSTGAVALEILPPIASWPAAEANRAAINSPDPKIRTAAWTAAAPFLPAPPAARPAAYAPLEVAMRTGALPAGVTVTLALYDQEIHSERYELQGSSVRWSWSEEDIGGSADLKPTADERKQLYRAIVTARGLDVSPVQELAGPYDPRLEIAVTSNDPRETASASVWAFEAAHHPRLAPWFSMLERWKLRASKP